MKTVEAKPFDQNAKNWKRENRLFTSTVLAAGAPEQNRIGVRTHSEVTEQFDSFSLLKLLFLVIVRNRHCWPRKAFPRQMVVHMLFRRKHRRHTASPSPVLLLNSIEIPFAESTRHLGVTLTSTLSWSEHIHNIIQRQQFKIFTLKRLARRRGAEDVVQQLYVGVVCLSIEYASALWDGCLRRDRIALERVQLAIALSVLRCPRQDRHNREVLRQIGWPTLAWRHGRKKLLFLWVLLNKQGPPDLASDLPKFASERADYSLRGPSRLAFPRCLTSQRLKSFLPASIELFNSLPASVSSCSSHSSFLFAQSALLKRHLFLWFDLTFTHVSFGSSRATFQGDPSH